MITNFHQGNSVGLTRVWNPRGNLTQLYYFNETGRGYGWGMASEKYLIYNDYSLVVDDIKLSLFVPFNKSQDIFAGSYFSILGYVEDLHSVDVEISSKKEDCILNLRWKLGGNISNELESKKVHNSE